MLIPYTGKSEYCYANSLHMSLAGAGATARDLPEVGFFECLTTMPFGTMYLHLEDGPLMFFSPPTIDPHEERCTMHYAISLPAFETLADARVLADLAYEAEQEGWDGFFLWDHLLFEPGMPLADPWIALTAIATRTQRIRFGTLVTPLPRRRPWKLARETATLDRLSNGRLILGVGIGQDHHREYSAFGEPADDKLHAEMLDEGLDVLTGLWTGAPFSFQGQHYSVTEAHFLPTPVQVPRIPIWVAGVWPHKTPLRRAARWDGVIPIHAEQRWIRPDEVREIAAYIAQHRTSAAPFDIVVAGYVGEMEQAEAAARLHEYAEAGVTWWQEGFWWTDTPDFVRERIRQGPPAGV